MAYSAITWSFTCPIIQYKHPDRTIKSSLMDTLQGRARAEIMVEARRRYDDSTRYLSVVEGNFDTGVFSIADLVEKHIQLRMKPIVIIDYLQILKPLSEQMNDKQNIDRSVISLKPYRVSLISQFSSYPHRAIEAITDLFEHYLQNRYCIKFQNNLKKINVVDKFFMGLLHQAHIPSTRNY